MSSIQDLFTATRVRLVRLEEGELITLFNDNFPVRVGDYLRVSRPSGSPDLTLGRIVGVEQCYCNLKGGWTARVKIAMMRRDGNLGVTKFRTIAFDKEEGLHGIGSIAKLLEENYYA